MFTVHLNQPSRLVVKSSIQSTSSNLSSSLHGDNAKGDIITILERGSILMLEPIERNSETWAAASCYHNDLDLPIARKSLFGPFSEISFDLSNFSFLNSFHNQNLAVYDNHEKNSPSLAFECNQQASDELYSDTELVQFQPPQIPLNFHYTNNEMQQQLSTENDVDKSNGGINTIDVYEFTSDDESASKKRKLSVQEDERPMKKTFGPVDSSDQNFVNVNAEVRIVRLPNSMTNLGEKASVLEQLYSSLEKSVLTKHNVSQHKQDDSVSNRQAQFNQKNKESPLPEQGFRLISKMKNLNEKLIFPVKQDIDESEYDYNEKDSDKSFEETPRPKITHRHSMSANLINLSTPIGTRNLVATSGEKVLKVLSKLSKTTNEATTRERKRVERITKQEIKYSKILPAIVIDVEEPRLILDLDTKTKEIRVEVDSILVKELKPHQIEGIKFMYNSTIESVSEIANEGSGCILAHCMGSGKTLQVITFVQTLLTNLHTKDHIKTILIAVPVNTMKSWIEELDKWITHNGLKTFAIHEMTNETNIEKRVECLSRWKNEGGILIIGFSLLANLLNLRYSKDPTIAFSTIDIVLELLADPGPDILIIDKDHRLKSANTRIYHAIRSMKTRRKIILTGTPLQNNLDEYHTMVNIIKPRLLGLKKEFVHRFLDPIENGQKADSNEADVKLMNKRSAVLNQLLSGCIQRFGFETLKPFLQPKYEYTLYIRPSKLIAEMYNFYLDNVTRKTNLFWDVIALRLCVNHPALYQLHEEREKFEKEASTEILPNKVKNENGSFDYLSDQSRMTVEPKKKLLLFKNWHQVFVNPDDWKNIELSGKFISFFKILKSCISMGDKLVVVSQSLETLDLIEKCLQLFKRIEINDEEKRIKWKLNEHYFRIDGGVAATERHDQLTKFNDPENTKARLFLLSAAAASIGVTLTGANRCIIFDVSWNPTDDIQAISSLYRLGQTKPVYVYRFVTKDTMEERIYRKQIVKFRTQVKSSLGQLEIEKFYDNRPSKSYCSIFLSHVPCDPLLSEILTSGNKEILKCREFDSLLEKKPEEKLTEDELKDAWDEYQKEINRSDGIRTRRSC